MMKTRSFVLINKMGYSRKLQRGKYLAKKGRKIANAGKVRWFKKKRFFRRWSKRSGLVSARRRLAANPRQLAGIVSLVVQALMARRSGARK